MPPKFQREKRPCQLSQSILPVKPALSIGPGCLAAAGLARLLLARAGVEMDVPVRTWLLPFHHCGRAVPRAKGSAFGQNS